MTSVGPDLAPTLSAHSARAKLRAFDFHTAAAGAGLGCDRGRREADQCDSRDQFLIENHDYLHHLVGADADVRAQLPLLIPAQGNHRLVNRSLFPVASILSLLPSLN